ncbi:MAG: methylated-DNA--[protein]-cysteine S-methyltransferase, partial [Gammaproteobacteria bacterium]|nr:methylated-DNA--[protein]-cysteine S-methyltransferase [Gammaproteobacteria bacterium]
MPENMFDTVLAVPFGQLLVSASDQSVTSIELVSTQTERITTRSIIAKKAIKQLQDYFVHAHNQWSLPLADKGTVFQNKVWQYLRDIPVGETRTYTEVASVLNTSARAVGNACRANPFMIVVPCHRVTSSTGIG